MFKCLAAALLLFSICDAQPLRSGRHYKDPLLNRRESSVYIRFQKVADATPVFEGEGRQRVWLTLKNNTRWRIDVQGIGVPDDYPANSFALIYTVEAVKFFIPSTPPPDGYDAEVRGSLSVASGETIEFSVPRNHLEAPWQIRVNFEFEWERNSRYTRHSTFFSFQDLPMKVRDLEKEKRLKARYEIGGGVAPPAEYVPSPLPSTLPQIRD